MGTIKHRGRGVWLEGSGKNSKTLRLGIKGWVEDGQAGMRGFKVWEQCEQRLGVGR